MPAGQPRNTDIFNRVVSKVLADLLESFPNPLDVHPPDVGVAIVDDDSSYDEMFADMHETAENSIRYLLDQGIVKQHKHPQTWDGPRFKSLVLSEDGLRLLGSVPDSVDRERDNRTFADRIIESAAGGKWSVASQFAKEALEAYRNRQDR